MRDCTFRDFGYRSEGSRERAYGVNRSVEGGEIADVTAIPVL